MSEKFIRPSDFKGIDLSNTFGKPDVDYSGLLKEGTISLSGIYDEYLQPTMTITIGRAIRADRLMKDDEVVTRFDPPIDFEPGTYEINLTTGEVKRIEP